MSQLPTQGIEKIPDSTGYLVLTQDGAVISSGGELENDEETANKISRLVHTATGIPVTTDRRDSFKRISIIWDDFMYVISVSSQKIFVAKRKYIPQDPVVT
ncbi:ragulator complex protein LAMTOR4 [Patella vulgata]|uniref:ragulator complex protein LAMTOR4 n=1 Tax=Patella vulgata TaxID=6465 RepID=UPI00217F4DC0|nr:ragulator complex protein LAMTOR4 [Patella vulgata]